MYAKQSSIEARRTPIHNNNSKTEFVLIYIRNRGLILYSIGCALCTLDYHITFTTQESIGREREECTTYMHARVFMCMFVHQQTVNTFFFVRIMVVCCWLDWLTVCACFVVIYFISSLIFHILSSLFLCGKNFLSAFLANESRKIKTQFMYISICFYTLVHFFSLAIVCLFVFNTRIVASSRAIFIYSNEMSCVGIKIVHVKLCWHSFDVVLTLCLVLYFLFLFIHIIFVSSNFFLFVCLLICLLLFHFSHFHMEFSVISFSFLLFISFFLCPLSLRERFFPVDVCNT